MRREQLTSKSLERLFKERKVVTIDQLKQALGTEATATVLLLDEQQRHFYTGLESLEWGHGGDRKMADLLGLDVGTVAKGRQQLVT